MLVVFYCFKFESHCILCIRRDNFYRKSLNDFCLGTLTFHCANGYVNFFLLVFCFISFFCQFFVIFFFFWFCSCFCFFVFFVLFFVIVVVCFAFFCGFFFFWGVGVGWERDFFMRESCFVFSSLTFLQQYVYWTINSI